ncbi:Crp/Fnr family transcriptional regulator [Sphingobacterium sp. SRCM116780]|uniref:Crp/Fnr family transcriptional regulator n=1 Tax=Sphingobacterium sp. SRCM116780 TaxID=2907623 RepID=UPI001F30FCA7|nr:Crp/Fnr family transcriptional regulator [Sphingobacterium sp. SRCM116780]UIR54830.1 Crp/Fnr family transcriptional regulator [Sphingobacterium sp. SRCM116780]
MAEQLLNHIRKYIKLDKETVEQIVKSFDSFDLPKRKLVLTAVEVCHYIYFVAKGCLRMFYLDEKGTEQTIQLALENWWMTDIDAFNRKGKATVSIQAVERATLIRIRKTDFDLLLERYSGLEKYFRMIYERAYSAFLSRMKYFRLPKEEFYHFFCAQYPDFIQRIPQKLLASFLGFTPEYLSELRKKNITVKE